MPSPAERNIKLLYAHNFLNDFRFQNAFVVIYFAQITGSYTMAMTILAAGTITAAMLDIGTGVFSDRVGRRYTLALGSLCCAISLSCYAVANHAILLFIGSIFGGLSQAFYNGNNNALLYESLREDGNEDRFHHYQGKTGSMFQLALGLSALAATFLTSYGLRFIFILGVIPQVLATMMSFFFHEPKIHEARQSSNVEHLKIAFGKIYHNPKLLLLTTAQSIGHGIGEANFNFENAFVASVCPLWAVPLYRFLSHFLGFAGYWFAGHVIDRFKNGFMLLLSSIYGLISGMTGILLNNFISPAIFVSSSLFHGPNIVAQEHLFQQEFTDEQRATMSSIASFAGSLIFGVAAIIIGQIADIYSVRIAVAFAIITSSITLPIYWVLFRKHLN